MSSEQLPYTDYGGVMRKRLGGRVQKLAIDAAISCPNRDGGVAYGGCTFCLNEAFSPSYCRESTSITEQIERGIAFHKARRREGDIYLAYLQSGSNTYGDIDHLERIYHETLTHPAISGIIIGTRPDCISSEILDILEHISKQYFVSIEYGIESTSDATLTHVNRGHTFAQARDTVALTRERNIECGAHFILGLPNETREQIVAHTEQINRLDIQSIKFHQLQIYRNTGMAREWQAHPERFPFANNFDTDNYVELMVDIIRHLDPSIAVERFASTAPRQLLLHSPLCGVRMDQLRNQLIEKMHMLGATQGDRLQIL
jgi:radical SAM protein (TIGR01212 family)